MSARGWDAHRFPGLSLLCWISIQDVLYTNLKGSSWSGQLPLTNIPPSCSSPCWKQNENHVQIGPKELFQGEQAHVFNYTDFALMTFTALLEKSFIPSSVLGSVGFGAVAVFVTGVNKLCCTLLNQTCSMATFHFSVLQIPS